MRIPMKLIENKGCWECWLTHFLLGGYFCPLQSFTVSLKLLRRKSFVAKLLVGILSYIPFTSNDAKKILREQLSCLQFLS